MKNVRGILACAAAASCATPDMGEAPEAIGDVIRGMGYTEVRRPLSQWEPGGVIAILDGVPPDAMLVCSPSGALGANFLPSAAPTMASEWRRATDRGISLGADVKAFNLKFGYNAVREIVVQLSNPTVYEISDEQFFAALRVAETSSACKDAIAFRVREGRAMTMIRTALKADVTYRITYNQGVDASFRNAHTSLIAGEVAGHAKAEGEDAIVGEQLIFGIKDDKLYLSEWAKAMPGLPQLAVSGEITPDERRLIPVDITINAVEN